MEAGKVFKSVVEGQVSSSTDPVESPRKAQPMSPYSDAAAGEMNGNLAHEITPFDPLNYAHISGHYTH